MNKHISRMINQNPHHGTGSDLDIGIYDGPIRCLLIEAMLWRYRGKRLPGRAAKCVYRAEKRYRKQFDRLLSEA